MSYLVFARKYRPQTFADILGQGPIVTTLTNAVRQGRVGHAYLFAGPRGTGKTSTARIFAKALNCAEGPTPTPCLACSQCEEIAQGRFLDVLEIDGASNRGIDQIRALREHSKFSTVSGAFKVYIIDEVHQITSEGFNALLKILEEPPSHVIFILATTAAHKVPATILSRCQRYDFKRLPLDLIASKLKGIAQEEKLHLSDEAAVEIGKAASGSLRDAESILDQAAAFTGGKIRLEDIETLLGTISEEIFAEAVSAIQAREPVRLLKLVAEAANSGTDLIQWVLEFLSFLRNLSAAKAGVGPLGFEDSGKEAIQHLQEISKGISGEELTVIAQMLIAAIETMRRVDEPRIPLELSLIRLSSGEPMAPVGELLNRLEQISRDLRGGAGVVSPQAQAVHQPSFAYRESRPQTPVAQKPPGSPFEVGEKARSAVSPPVAGLEGILSVWPVFVGQIQQQKAMTAAYLSEARPVQLDSGDPDQLVIGLPKGSEFQLSSLEKLPVRQLIEQVLKDLMGRAVRCSFKISDNLPESVPVRSQKEGSSSGDPAGRLENSPSGGPPSSLVDSVVDLFEGRVLPGRE